jgi:16S rRNA (cytosine967-C5)-methyltransferase
MTPAARVQAAIDLLDAIIAAARDGGAAADVVATRWFKERRYAGSGDRRAIREWVWAAIRRFGEVPPSGRAAMVALADDDAGLAALFSGQGHAPAPIAADEPRAAGGAAPGWLRPLLDPLIDAREIPAMLDRAPLDIRINPLRAAGVALPDGTSLPAPLHGLRLPADTPVMDSPAWAAGAIEVQDAGSQWIAQACAAQPGMTILDLCAGGGGKALALASAAAGKARIVAADIDRRRLGALPPRAERAGAVIETRLLDPGKETPALADLVGQCDVVLIDAPCSGSGTWRRNPEARWRLTPARLDRLVAQQQRLLDIAAPLVAPGGALVYAVCAVTRAEGAGQAAAFLARAPGWRAVAALPEGVGRDAGPGRLLTPRHDATDGFFLARFVAE